MRNHQKIVSLREKWGARPAYDNQPALKKSNYSVNLNQIMREISQDEQLDQINRDQLKINEKNGNNQDVNDQRLTIESDTIVINNTNGLLNESLNICSESEQSCLTSNRSSIQMGDSSTYNYKCQRFESALRKVDLDNFVLYNKVDEFLLLRKSQSENENTALNSFQPLEPEIRQNINLNQTEIAYKQYSNLQTEPQQRGQVNQDLRSILQKRSNGKFEISNRKRAQKFVYKQWEKDCQSKFGQKFSKLLNNQITHKRENEPVTMQSKIYNYLSSQVERKTITIAKSPKSHLKDRANIKDEQNRVSHLNRTISMKAPSSQFKAKKFNKNLFKGVFGIPPPQERPATQFIEFDLSYKKMKPQQDKENITPYTQRDGRISVKKIVALHSPKSMIKMREENLVIIGKSQLKNEGDSNDNNQSLPTNHLV
ncbi:UNKNOWN [Stylonychia lemnae]|uniref:Uncharacterized protein n=1 Tax=Stylonychia lemnae TaxID=5949 RepID=A0A078AY86_STYLE|nr:UNKNOWN [Stylonychia lemnae]|eukprot:CDW85758.1 UNKNOWN [Stylonychia lemnae]